MQYSSGSTQAALFPSAHQHSRTIQAIPCLSVPLQLPMSYCNHDNKQRGNWGKGQGMAPERAANRPAVSYLAAEVYSLETQLFRTCLHCTYGSRIQGGRTHKCTCTRYSRIQWPPIPYHPLWGQCLYFGVRGWYCVYVHVCVCIAQASLSHQFSEARGLPLHSPKIIKH